ncbi:NAD(P)/FAD-dependent oxidoreductase [Anaerotardibacter muris]|uniref:NAD(P)/FAD-dependent oxidoreductase n=1 Tax=Anaerotardibacter muris TaxID=2941505 RepID=UPI0020413A13|nr:FAD-dependent oxidoreductase [Anaerotardibacter muris]
MASETSEQTENETRITDVAIVGAGPAGMTAALYVARAGYRATVLEAYVPGGQLTTIDELENYPGFFGGVNGFDIASSMQKQAERFGVQFMYAQAKSLERYSDRNLFEITTNDEPLWARSVIIASGAKPLKLPQIDSDKLEGKGLSYCATCDGNFYRGKDVMIVGGGDSAITEAIYLSRICRKVYLVHRREDFRAHFWVVERVKHLPNVEIFWNNEVQNVITNDSERIEAVTVRNSKTGEEHTLEVEGLFIAIGAKPESEWAKDAVELDKFGYVKSHDECHTSLKGVFVAGDVRTTPLRQVVTATADGALAAEAAVAYLSE